MVVVDRGPPGVAHRPPGMVAPRAVPSPARRRLPPIPPGNRLRRGARPARPRPGGVSRMVRGGRLTELAGRFPRAPVSFRAEEVGTGGPGALTQRQLRTALRRVVAAS